MSSQSLMSRDAVSRIILTYD